MITFFRQLRKTLIEDNQSRKYMSYAIGEVLLVVVGILIALQINNWNEWRKERILEKTILLDLANNLQRNIALAELGIAEIKQINRSSEIVIRFIEQDMPYSDTLHYHFGQMGRSGSFIVQLNKDGYESYKNIGFEILTSKSLKNEILTLFEISYPDYESVVEVTNALWEHDPLWWNDYFIDKMALGKIPIDPTKIKGNHDVINIVRILLQQRHTLIEKLGFVINESQDVLQLIREELGELD